VRTLAEASFGWIPRCDDPPRVTVTEPEQTELRKLTIEPDNGPVPIAGIAFRAVPDGHPDAVALEMLMQILGGGESSRIYIDLVRRKEVAMMGMGLYAGMEQAGFAAVVGITQPAPFGKPEKVIDALWEQVDLVRNEGVTDEELAKVRKQVLRADVTSALTVESKASALGQAAALWGDTQEANERVKRLEAVTKADIQRVATTYLLPERATEVMIKPSLASAFRSMLSGAAALDDKPEDDLGADEEEIEGGERALAGGPKASAMPPPGYPEMPPASKTEAPRIDLSAEERVLDNGLKVVVVENHEVPFLSMALRLSAGAFTEDPAHPGVASMAASLITKGTVARDAEALALELEKNAISLSAGAGHDASSVSVSCLTEDAERAMRLLSEVVQVPRFDDKEFRTLRDQTATGMAISEKTPSVIADRTLDQALWGNHPYGRPAEGTSTDLKDLEPSMLRHWWERFVRPDTAVLYVAGDVTLDEAVAMADRYLGTWEAEGEPVEVPLPAFEPPQDLRITLVDKPGAIQSEIRAAHGGLTRSNPLYSTGVVISQIFGGSFSSRLNDVIRVQKGLTYGARGGLSSQRFGGEFRVSTFTKTPTTAETVQAVLDEVVRMRDEAPSGKELEDALAYITGSFAGSLETPQAVAGRLWTLELNRLPKDWWSQYVERVASLTADDVTSAAHDLLDPTRLRVVVVGDAEAVQASLEEIAPVDVIKQDEGGG
jgi:zinc protease